MKERIWRRARTLRLARRLYRLPLCHQTARKFSLWLCPADKTAVVRIREGLGKGLLIELNPRWEVNVWNGVYEPEVQEFLEGVLTPGSTFWDIGAGRGLYSLIAARRGCFCFAFEPFDRNARFVEENAARNGLNGKIRVVRAAASSHSGRVWLRRSLDLNGLGNARIQDGPAPEEAQSDVCGVPAVSLDDFAEAHGACRVLKIDVEGCEREVLAGAERLVAMARPAIAVEVHDSVNGQFAERWLRSRGYRLERGAGAAGYPFHLFAWN